MAWRATKCHMGLSNNCKDTNMRNIIQTNIWYWSGIPIEVGMSSLRWAYYDDHNNNEELKLALDCLSKVRDDAA